MTEQKTEAELAAEKKAEEEAKAEETAKAEKEAQDAEFEESLKDLSDEEKEAKREEQKKALNSKTEPDYKALAEEEKQKANDEKERADAAERALADDRYKASEAKRKVEEGTEEEKEPLTKKDYEAGRAKDRQENQKQIQKAQAQTIVEKLTDNADEQEYVLEIHKNRIFPEHLSLQDQLEESHAIANKDKWKGERDEALRKAKGDKGVNDDAAGAHRKPPASQAGEPSMSAEDKQMLVNKGWKWNTTNKRYEKTTSSGILLYRDPKTGAVKPEGKTK